MNWVWRKPELTRDGQVAFWNRQARTYEATDMTNDNPHEIERVIERTNPGVHSEIVTLGGAVGCRDPLMVLRAKYCSKKGGFCSRGPRLPRIFFNDIAQEMARKAEESFLAGCKKCGVEMEFFPGHIMDVCDQVRKDRPRMLLLGVYSDDGLFSSYPQNRYDVCGFDEYMKHRKILGDGFWFDWLILRGGSLQAEDYSGVFVESDWPADKLSDARNRLSEKYSSALESSQLIAVQVVSIHRNLEGFFISHWFNARRILSLLREVFPDEEFEIKEDTFPKGMLFAIERRNSVPEGIVTILNNVLGNVLPQEQISTLNRVKDIL